MQHYLADLIKSGESETLDFKQKITSLDKIAKTICSFANSRGGILLVGVKDDRTITGIDPEEEKYMLDQAAQHYCQPPINLEYVEIENEEELSVLMVTVAESTDKPHASLHKTGEWQVYLRQRDKSIPAGPEMIRHLKKGDILVRPGAADVLDKNELRVMNYLHVHGRISTKELISMANFSKRRAQHLLNEMVLKGIIRLFEHEKEDYYA